MKEVIIIAEIGENHVGDIGRARQMIREAAKAGANIAKFQSYLPTDVAPNDPERDWFCRVTVSNEGHFELKRVADENSIAFMSAPFSLERAVFLVEKLGLKKLKIASSEMLNLKVLDYVNGQADTVFLSTGMATLEEVQLAVSHLKDVKHVYVLHCTTQYPTKPEDANLLAIPYLKKHLPDVHVGYSDHTLGIRAAVTAAALGAEAIEKHFTLDKTLPGTDHVLSADPGEFRAMVEEIRAVAVLLGDYDKRPTAAEASIREFVRSRFPK